MKSNREKKKKKREMFSTPPPRCGIKDAMISPIVALAGGLAAVGFAATVAVVVVAVVGSAAGHREPFGEI